MEEGYGQGRYRRRVRVSSSQLHPIMEMHGKRFHCNGQLINLERKPLSSKIIARFMEEKDLTIPKDELVKVMTGGNSKGAQRRSAQYEWTRGQSLNRLMSRLRIEFESKFQGVVPAGLHWFHYDNRCGLWLLYKLPGEGANGKLYA